MTNIDPINHIARKESTGTPYVAGTGGLTVAFLSTLINDPEWSMEKICENYPVTPAQVYAAWSYYYDHQSEIDAWMRRGSEKAQAMGESFEQFKAKIEAQHQDKEISSAK